MGLESFIYKKEVDWSLLKGALTLPVENQVVFGRVIDRFLIRGEYKNIFLVLEGKAYKAKIRNVNFAERHGRVKDTLQIRYPQNGEFARALQAIFHRSYKYILETRQVRDPGDRSMIRLPEGAKEYLAIYTSEYDDTYVLDAIVCDDIYALQKASKSSTEYILETSFNYDIKDESTGIYTDNRVMKFRRLNRAIGDNLKLVYNYRCQICGIKIGDQYDAKVVEVHHIDYFIKSLNNNQSNLLIVCPNHHSIIHNVDPQFNRNRKLFVYKNGIKEGLKLNCHL